MTDRIGEQDAIARSIKGSSRSEEFTAELATQEAARVASGSVQHKHRHTVGMAQRGHADAQLRHDLAGVKAKVRKYDVVYRGLLPIVRTD